MTTVVNPLKSVFKPLQGYNPRHPLSFSAFSHSPAKLLSGWFLGFEMAGYWIKFDTSTPDKPEVWAIAENLSIDPDAVVGKLLRVWAWFDDQTEKGNAPSVTKALLDRSVGVSGFCAAMILAGWMLEEGGVISIPNFDRHNGSTAKSRCLTASRVAKHKKSNATGNAPLTLDALPRREEKRREENTHTHTHGAFGKADVPSELAECWSRWCLFRLSVDGREVGAIQAEAVLMELGRRGAEKASRDIDFSIRKNAKSILDSDNDFERRDQSPQKTTKKRVGI